MALAAAHEVNAPLPVTATVEQLVEGCIGSGMGDLDLMALLPRLRREAGLDAGCRARTSRRRRTCANGCRPGGRPRTRRPRTGSSPRFASRCGTVESNEIESPGPST